MLTASILYNAVEGKNLTVGELISLLKDVDPETHVYAGGDTPFIGLYRTDRGSWIMFDSEHAILVADADADQAELIERLGPDNIDWQQFGRYFGLPGK